MRPILAIAATTVGEAIRRRVLLVILLIGVLFIVVAPGLGILSARSETTVLRAFMLGVIQGVSMIIAVILTVYMIPNEIERHDLYDPIKACSTLAVPCRQISGRGSVAPPDDGDDVRSNGFRVLPAAAEQERWRSRGPDEGTNDVLRADVPVGSRRNLFLDVLASVSELLHDHRRVLGWNVL